MFKKLLLATSAIEASNHAARVAFNIASTYDAYITIFHVIGVPSRGFGHFILDVKTNKQVEFNNDYVEWVKEEIKDYYSKQIKTIKSYDIKLAVGYPYLEILRISREIKPDLIVLGGRTGENSSYKKNILGSTAHRVTESANCPVLLINRPAASFWGGISNIIFVTDLTKTFDSAFLFTLKLVKKLNCEFHILKVIDISFNNLSQDKIDLQIRKNLLKMRELYFSNIKSISCDKYFFSVWEGIPYIEIVKYARENYADLIIISNNYKNNNINKRLENNIEQIIIRSNCPVISVGKNTL